MSYLQKWGKLLELYRQINRQQIIRSTYLEKPLRQAWSYWAAFSLYWVLSCLLFTVNIPFWASIILFSVLIVAIYTYFEKRIQKEYSIKYRQYNLFEHPFLYRSYHLSYILFSELLDKTQPITVDDIDSIIEWEKIRKEKISSLGFLYSPIWLIILTSLSTLGVEYLNKNDLINSKYIVFIFSFVIIAIWFAWMITDSLQSRHKIHLDVCKLLKCYKLDKAKS